MVWSAISYQGRSNLLRIAGNLNSNRYIREVIQPEVVYFLQSIPGAIFQQEHVHVLRRLFETSGQPYTSNFFLGPLIRWICRLLGTCEIWLVCFSLVICVLQFQKTTLAQHTRNMEFCSTRRHSKSVGLHVTSYSSTYCKHLVATPNTDFEHIFFYFFFENFVIFLYENKSLCIKFHIILMIPWCCIFHQQYIICLRNLNSIECNNRS